MKNDSNTSSYKPFIRPRIIIYTLLFAGLFCGNSCISPPSAQFNLGFARNVYPLTADSQWAVLTWLLESDEVELFMNVDADEVEKVRYQTGRVIFRNWCKKKSGQFSFFRLLDGDLFFTGDVPSKGQISEAVEALENPIKIKPELRECLGFSWARNLRSTGFPEWLEEFGDELFLPENKFGDRSVATTKLKASQETYLVKEVILHAKNEAKKGNYEEAYKKLHARAMDYPTNQDLLEVIATVSVDYLSSEIKKFRKHELVPIENRLKNLKGKSKNKAELEKLIADTESAFEVKVKTWLDDIYLSRALGQISEEFSNLQRDVGLARAKLWVEELRELTGKKRFWSAYLLFKSKTDEASTYTSPIKDVIADELWKLYLSTLPDAANHFLDFGSTEMENAERHGVALIISDMLHELISFAKDNGKELPAAMNKSLKRLDDLQKRSTEFFETWVQRKLILGKFTSGHAGLGTTFLRDLEVLFQNRLRKHDLVYGVELSDALDDAKKIDYVLSKGNIGSFSVDKGLPEENLELATRFGEVIQGDNPEFLDRVRKNKVTTGIPELLFTQKIYRYTKHTTALDMVVHARLTFTVLHRNIEDFFEINEFMKKRFVREKIDPRETIVKIEKVSGPEAKQPELRNDVIWVSSQMKDWARVEAEQILVMNVTRVIADYPNWLAETAENHISRGQPEVAANFWGFCLEYCNKINPNPEGIKAQLDSGEVVEHMVVEMKENLRTARKLQKLKDSVRDKSIDTVLSLLEP